MAAPMSKTQRSSVARVYAKRSARERAALRKFDPLRVFQTLLNGPGPGDPEAWGFRISLTDPHSYGGRLVVQLGYDRRVSIEYRLIGVSGTYLIPYTGVDFIGPIQELLGFDREYRPEENTLWHFEIEQRAEHDPLYRALKSLLKESIADVHLLHDGSYCRPYTLRGLQFVEYRGREDRHVTVSGLEHFLKLKGVEVYDARLT